MIEALKISLYQEIFFKKKEEEEEHSTLSESLQLKKIAPKQHILSGETYCALPRYYP